MTEAQIAAIICDMMSEYDEVIDSCCGGYGVSHDRMWEAAGAYKCCYYLLELLGYHYDKNMDMFVK